MGVTLGLAWKLLLKTGAFLLFICSVYFARELLYETFDPTRKPVRRSEAVLCPPLPASAMGKIDPGLSFHSGSLQCPGRIS